MNKKILILIFVIALGVFAFIYLKKLPGGSAETNISQNNTEEEGETLPEVIPGEVKKVDEQNNSFFHKQYNFSLNYPSNMKVSNFREGDGEQVIFQDDNKNWFQIYITPWDEEEGISVNRIKKDLPNIVIKEPNTVILGPGQKEGVGPKALIFFSQDSGLGETREVWFVAEGNLYQIVTYKRLDLMLGKVLSTLVFN